MLEAIQENTMFTKPTEYSRTLNIVTNFYQTGEDEFEYSTPLDNFRNCLIYPDPVAFSSCIPVVNDFYTRICQYLDDFISNKMFGNNTLLPAYNEFYSLYLVDRDSQSTKKSFEVGFRRVDGLESERTILRISLISLPENNKHSFPVPPPNYYASSVDFMLIQAYNFHNENEKISPMFAKVAGVIIDMVDVFLGNNINIAKVFTNHLISISTEEWCLNAEYPDVRILFIVRMLLGMTDGDLSILLSKTDIGCHVKQFFSLLGIPYTFKYFKDEEDKEEEKEYDTPDSSDKNDPDDMTIYYTDLSTDEVVELRNLKGVSIQFGKGYYAEIIRQLTKTGVIVQKDTMWSKKKEYYNINITRCQLYDK
jgi:hypothetical protein